MRRWIIIGVILTVIVPTVGVGAWTWAALKFAYSSGDRAGYVQKISNKGWLCKTWEGELAMSTVPGTAPQVFAFSVRDESVANQIRMTSGQRVRITYEQHRGLPTSCFGETEYFVTGVQAVGP
ncbi:MAG: hypothetical protein FJW30_27165 [Acidobacteria bacterium]|nr:hypothetical protein [Acidobacteriota bacterium]